MSKLHPIYVALDSHQYGKAIKLGAALPASNVLGKALLAHAYLKSGQRHEALKTLQAMLGSGNFAELDFELECNYHGRTELFKTAQQRSNQPQPQSSSKRGKKGKKSKPPAKPAAPAVAAVIKEPLDWIDYLDKPSRIREGWHVLPPPDKAITDETTLATMAVTMTNMRLMLTSYQVHAWAATADPSNETTLTKCFGLGMSVLAQPAKFPTQKDSIEAHVLKHMQMLSLQWAKLVMSRGGKVHLTTAWAAQTCLWQLNLLHDDDENSQRATLIPRLAESMAKKLLTGIDNDPGQAQSAESQLLALRVYEHQSKWSDMVQILETAHRTRADPAAANSGSTATNDSTIDLTSEQVLTQLARVYNRDGQYDASRKVVEETLRLHPDDWASWKSYLDCSIRLHGLQEGTVQTIQFASTILDGRKDSKYPLRGPQLILVETKARMLKEPVATSQASSSSRPQPDTVTALANAIIEYAEQFARTASCAFSDIEAYLDVILQLPEGGRTDIQALLEWAASYRSKQTYDSAEDDSKEQRSKLRGYIFTIQVTHKILAANPQLSDHWMPKVQDTLAEWKTSLSLHTPGDAKEGQKENKAGDELVLLSSQQILHTQNCSKESLMTAATLLELGIEHSPDNAMIKIAAVDVHCQLNATWRALEIFHTISLKHIQMDSCSYIVQPKLLRGGLYDEAVELSQLVLRFQSTSARDCGEYSARAMENGTLSKADEFLVFQRDRLNCSLASLQAKGYILDCAPLLSSIPNRKRNAAEEKAEFLAPLSEGGLGIRQGIVGDADDTERAKEMISAAFSPESSLSLVTWVAIQLDPDATKMTLSDNRDASIYSNNFLYKPAMESKIRIENDCMRRGLLHGLLIRATLCMESTKGPKKGKVVAVPDKLKKHAASLQSFAEQARKYFETIQNDEEPSRRLSSTLLSIILALCEVILTVGTGSAESETDSMATRETKAESLMQAIVPTFTQARDELTAMSKDATPDAMFQMTCCLVPDALVPLFAMFSKLATLLDLFGWGKRKRKTKRCAAAFADVACALRDILQQLVECGIQDNLPSSVENNSDGDDKSDAIVNDDLAFILEDKIVEQTRTHIHQARYRSRLRVEPILCNMAEVCQTFDVTDL